MTSRLICLFLISALGACVDNSYVEPPPGAEPIPVNDPPARYHLLEREVAPDGIIRAVVLQSFPNGRPGSPLGFQIKCGEIPRWFDNGPADLAGMRTSPVPPDQWRSGSDSRTGEQIAIFLCE